MSAPELVAFLLGLANVTLVVKRSVWNYPFGIAMVSLYGVVFRDARLYSDALLQLFFLVVNIYGWWSWRRAQAQAGDIVVERLSAPARLGWALGCLIATGLWGTLMATFTDASYPWWDAGVAIVSIAAQVMMAQRKLENWLLWIAVDVASIGLYAAKGLWLTMVLYVIFLALATWGWLDWRSARRQRAPETVPAAA